jgi:hypothetical protein
MDFHDMIIEKEAYAYFKALSSSAKLRFIYEMMCTEDEDEVLEDDNLDLTVIPKNALPSEPKERIKFLVEKSLEDHGPVSTIAVKDTFILNSDSLGLMKEQIRNLFSLGYVLYRKKLSPEQKEIFTHKRYSAVLQIVGKANFLFSN